MSYQLDVFIKDSYFKPEPSKPFNLDVQLKPRYVFITVIVPVWIPKYSRIDLPIAEKKDEEPPQPVEPIKLPRRRMRAAGIWVWKPAEPARAEEPKPPDLLGLVLKRRQKVQLSRMLQRINELRYELGLPAMRLPRSRIQEPEGVHYSYLEIRELRYRLVHELLRAELRRLKRRLRATRRN